VQRGLYHNWITVFVVLLLVVGLSACSMKPDIAPQKAEALAAQADTPVRQPKPLSRRPTPPANRSRWLAQRLV